MSRDRRGLRARVRQRLDRYTDRSTPLVVLSPDEWKARHS